MPFSAHIIGLFIAASAPIAGVDSVPTTVMAGASARLMMPPGVEVTPPGGFVRMCNLGGVGCDRPPQPGGTASGSDEELMRLIKRVNRGVNDAITFRDDRAEHWARPVPGHRGTWMAGDCEDYAIEKRARLIAAGFPPERLFYAVGYRRSIGLHAVLVARLGGRDLVLDNRTPWVRAYADTPYTWVAHQSLSDPRRWFSSIALSQS